MTAERVLQTTDLHAGYLPGVNILNGCNVHVDKGELVGIIGPNGAGKSTLLKAIFGQVNVRGGSIELNGQDITGLKADKLVSRGVGMVPQNNNVFPELTIDENLQMGHLEQDLAGAADVRFRDETGQEGAPDPPTAAPVGDGDGLHVGGVRAAGAKHARRIPLGRRTPEWSPCRARS